MVSASQINDLIRSYLSGSLSLQRFAEAFEAVYSEINVANPSKSVLALRALGDHLQVLLGRVSSGYASENDLREWLYSLSQTSSPDGSESVQPVEVHTYSRSQGHLISVTV